jgi:proline iminopeptidase
MTITVMVDWASTGVTNATWRPDVERFPSIEPFAQDMLEVGDGQRIYWETSGNPDGKPAVVLHGGPGSGSSPERRRLFDPQAYLIVQFDQRGAGRSTPYAGDPATDLSANTTHHLIADMERLREHLGVQRWLVWGGSWGVTLGLVYAERNPERVSELVLASVTMTRPAEVHWLYHEVGRYFPEQWERFRSGVPEDERDGDLVAAYYRLLNESSDLAVRERAARAWCSWEDELLSNEAGWQPNPRYADPAFRMAFARIVTHYFHHHAWLADGQILRDAERLAGIPGVLIHGRFDLGSPADTAWLLARAWPDAELHLVGTGHAGGEEMTTRILKAINQFAQRR